MKTFLFVVDKLLYSETEKALSESKAFVMFQKSFLSGCTLGFRHAKFAKNCRHEFSMTTLIYDSPRTDNSLILVLFHLISFISHKSANYLNSNLIIAVFGCQIALEQRAIRESSAIEKMFHLDGHSIGFRPQF